MPDLDNPLSGVIDGLKDGLAIIFVPYAASLLGICMGLFVAGDIAFYELAPGNLMFVWAALFVFCWAWLPFAPIGFIPFFIVLGSVWWYWRTERFRPEAFAAIMFSTATLVCVGGFAAGELDVRFDAVRIGVAVVAGVAGMLAARYGTAWWRMRRDARLAEKLTAEPRPPSKPPGPTPEPPPLGFHEERDE